MPRRDAEETGKYIVLAAIAGAITLAVVGGAFWLMFRHPNESEQAKQAREQRQRDREYYDALGPYDAEAAAKREAEIKKENDDWLTAEARRREEGRLKVRQKALENAELDRKDEEARKAARKARMAEKP